MTDIKYSESILDTYYPDWRTTAPLPPDLLLLCMSYNYKVDTYHDYYKIKSRIERYGDQKHGLEEWWYGNGQPWRRSIWFNGEKHGLEEWWHGNGDRWRRSIWNNGKKHGLEESWYDGEKIMSRCNWINGEKHGLEEEWAPNGRLICRYNWV